MSEIFIVGTGIGVGIAMIVVGVIWRNNHLRNHKRAKKSIYPFW